MAKALKVRLWTLCDAKVACLRRRLMDAAVPCVVALPRLRAETEPGCVTTVSIAVGPGPGVRMV